MGIWKRLRGLFAPTPSPADDQLEFMTWDQYVAWREANDPGPDPPGVLVMQRDPDMAVYWPSWAAWRFGQRAPEHVWLEDVEDHTHKILGGTDAC